MKDEFLANLVATNKRVPDSKLVHEIGSENDKINSESIQSKAQSEGPSMMDMMMAAHVEAKKEETIVKKGEAIKVTKTFGGGFKIGFFGDKKGGKIPQKELSEKDTYLSWMQNKPIENTESNPINANTKEISSPLSSDDIPNIKRNKSKDLSKVPSAFTADVQKALSEEESPVHHHHHH
jgi:hypothetical protein